MRLLFLLVALAIASALPARSVSVKHLLRGKIVTAETDQPLEYATVSAYTQDSTLVEGTITNAEGFFTLRLTSGAYRLHIEYIGFTTREIPVTVDQDIDLGTLSLGSDAVALDAVEVTAQKSQLNLQLDKKVFNVGQDLLSRSGSATDVLDNVPSVSVEPDGTISLRGNSGVKILINGRPSSIADNNALSSLPAASIERIEVITNPSARYESAGNAGIINIVLKANREFGFNGTATVTGGYPADYQPVFNFNLRKNKVNFFGNLGAKYADYKGRGNSSRTNFLEGIPAFIEQSYQQDRNDVAGFGFVGVDYFINEQQTITASYSNYSVVNEDQTTLQIDYLDRDRVPEQQWLQTLDYREPESYNQLDLAYTKTYDQEGKKLTINLQHDFWFNEETENIHIAATYPTPEDLLRLRTVTDESSKDYLLQSDYQTRLGEHGRFEAGIRGETRVIVSDYIAESLEDDEWAVYRELDNRLDYYERIGGAYVQYGQELGKFNYLLGLRTEYTLVRVENANQEDVISKTYTRLFPTANLSYQLAETASAQLSYSRRIRRPSFWQLNPFGGLSDPNELFVGNSDIDPAYTDRIEFNFLRSWEQLTLNPAVYFSRTLDYFATFIQQQPDGLVLRSPINLDRENNYGVEVTLTYRPTDWIDLYGEINYFGYSQQGLFADRDFAFSSDTWQGSTRLQLQSGTGWMFQGSFDYRARYRDAQINSKALYYASFALAKRLANDRLTITFNLFNAFDSREYRRTITQPTFTQFSANAWNVRRFKLDFTYRIQKGKKLPVRRVRGSIR